jgi:hypothetical protein
MPISWSPSCSARSREARGGVVVLARHGDALDEEARFPATSLGQGPLGFSVAFADTDTVLFTTFGRDAASGATPLDDTAARCARAPGKGRRK